MYIIQRASPATSADSNLPQPKHQLTPNTTSSIVVIRPNSPVLSPRSVSSPPSLLLLLHPPAAQDGRGDTSGARRFSWTGAPLHVPKDWLPGGAGLSKAIRPRPCSEQRPGPPRRCRPSGGTLTVRPLPSMTIDTGRARRLGRRSSGRCPLCRGHRPFHCRRRTQASATTAAVVAQSVEERLGTGAAQEPTRAPPVGEAGKFNFSGNFSGAGKVHRNKEDDATVAMVGGRRPPAIRPQRRR